MERILLGLAFVLLSTGTYAQTIKIVGVGAASCSQYLSEIQAGPTREREYFAWAQGYMNGLLVRAPAGVDENLDLAPAAFPLSMQADFLRTFCERSRSADFSDAVGNLYKTLRTPSG